MSEPIRSAPSSPFACVRPQVQSRRVSFRLGPFGLTYSTDRVLWNAEGGATPSSPASSADPPPVDPAPGLGAHTAPRAAPDRPSPSPSPAEVEAALRQARLWQAAERQAVHERGQAQGTGQAAGGAARAGTVHAGQAAVGQATGAGPLRNALRQASQAYLACAANIASPPPMLQAVA